MERVFKSTIIFLFTLDLHAVLKIIIYKDYRLVLIKFIPHFCSSKFDSEDAIILYSIIYIIIILLLLLLLLLLFINLFKVRVTGKKAINKGEEGVV